MSLIADSLKKAVKEKSAPKWEANREINPVSKREPLKRPGLATVFRVLLLVVFPAAVFVYLISIGAFALKKTPVAQTLDVPVSIPRPTEKSPIEEETAQQMTAVVPDAVAVIKAPEESPASKKEEAVFKKVIPPYPPKKKAGKPEAVTSEIPKEKAASLPSPELKPASPATPKIPPAVAKKKIVTSLPVEPTEKTVSEAKPVLEKKVEVPEEVAALESQAVEIPDEEIATKSEVPARPLVEPFEGKAEVPIEQKTAPAVEEKKIVTAPPVEPTEKTVSEAKAVLEKKVVVPEEVPAPKPSEKPVVEKAEVSPKVSDGIKKDPQKLTIDIQKENSQIASLPSSMVKPEIFRTDPAGRENVFNNSDYFFNRGIFFQQARDWQKALDNYSKSEELDPDNPDTYNNKGVIFKEMGKFDQALDEFLRAVYLDAGYAKAYNNIGVVYFMKKNYPEAIRHYLKAIDLNPTNLEAFNNLAIIYKKQKELDRARAVLNKALSLDPDHPGTNYNLAVLYEENSEIKPALHFYRRFIELGSISYPSLVIQVKEHLKIMKRE